VDASLQTDSEQKGSVFLYGFLASLVKQGPLLVVKQVKMSNGYEAYRQLIQSCEPLNKNRAMSLLSIIMNWPVFNSKASLLSQVLRLETAYAECEKRRNKLADVIKAAVLLRSVTGNVKPRLQLRVNDKTTFSQLRELVLTYDQQVEDESMVLGQVDDDPMNVSRTEGKDKGEDKVRKEQRQGHGMIRKRLWKLQGIQPVFRFQRKRLTGAKERQRTLAKTSSVVYHRCHKQGHARDCWSGKEKARQVNEKGGENNSTHTPLRAHHPKLPPQVRRAAKCSNSGTYF
jgi:hypothetical protein